MRRRIRDWAAFGGVLMLSLGSLAGCGPPVTPKTSREARDNPASAVAPAPPRSAPVDIEASLATLASIPIAVPLGWDLVEGVEIAPSTIDAKLGSGKAVALRPTKDAVAHRIGLSGDFGRPQKYRVKIWVKGVGGVNVMVEARGKTLTTPERAADYAVGLFDLSSNQELSNSSLADQRKFSSATVSDDGEWKKITLDTQSGDSWLYVVIGATSRQGAHVYAGSSGGELIIGGVEVAPNS